MQFDRRIANGLAWAGAVLVVAIPAADAMMGKFAPRDTPQLAVVDARRAVETEDAPALPTPSVQRPAMAATTEAAAPKPAAIPAPGPEKAADPVKTASVSGSDNDAVDAYLQSGRALPSYISDGPTPAPTAGNADAPTQAVAPTAAAPQPDVVALAPRTKVVTFPTPVSERPAPMPRTAATQPPLVVEPTPPLVIDRPERVVTAEELEDWESGPLTEFLAGRQQSAPAPAAPGYDANGFFLDEGPNSSARMQRFPRAYGYDVYTFE